MSRLLLLFTGGTISMKLDPASGAAVPALCGSEILEFVPRVKDVAQLEVFDFGRMPGPHWTPEKMLELSEQVNAAQMRPDIEGVVVTHGTDTLEETAFLVDLRLRSAKPAVFTGAMRNASEYSFDGPANLLAAVRVAADPTSAGQGAMVVLNDAIHAASEVTKINAQSLGAFASPVFGPLGLVEPDRLYWKRRLNSRRTVLANGIEPRVDLIKAAAGVDGRFIDFARESGARGIVIEGTGRGNVPPSMLHSIGRAIAAGLPVVVASRCPEARVLDTYGYPGSGRDLRRLGAILAGTLPGQKARILLIAALGLTRNVDEIRALVEREHY